jgi:hypothetical protein
MDLAFDEALIEHVLERLEAAFCAREDRESRTEQGSE